MFIQTHTHGQTMYLLKTHELRVAASDPHPSTQGMGCSLIIKHPEQEKSYNKFSWEGRGRGRAKY